MQIYVNSHWGVQLKGRFVDNHSDTLCIILPGIAYLLDRSYLDYSKKMASEEQMDVYEMEYGFQITRDSFDISSEFDLLAEESIKAILTARKKTYKRYVIIGKSIGTCIQILLNKALEGEQVTNVYISPINKTASLGITKNSLVITGLADPLLSHDALEQIKMTEGVTLITVPDANHSLDVEHNILKSIDVLKDCLTAIRNHIVQ